MCYIFLWHRGNFSLDDLIDQHTRALAQSQSRSRGRVTAPRPSAARRRLAGAAGPAARWSSAGRATDTGRARGPRPGQPLHLLGMQPRGPGRCSLPPLFPPRSKSQRGRRRRCARLAAVPCMRWRWRPRTAGRPRRRAVGHDTNTPRPHGLHLI
jgi:hypothetical protein